MSETRWYDVASDWYRQASAWRVPADPLTRRAAPAPRPAPEPTPYLTHALPTRPTPTLREAVSRALVRRA